MYHAGEFLGFLNEQRKLHPAAIPKEDIENPEQYQAVYDRLAELSDFSGAFKPTADFSLFEVCLLSFINLHEDFSFTTEREFS